MAVQFKKPCLECGELTREGSRCLICVSELMKRRIEREGLPYSKINKRKYKGSSSKRGYNAQWKRLSESARALQPFCTDCLLGVDELTRNNPLTADHSVEAWKRYEKGLAVRMRDIEVVCLKCNINRGKARGVESRPHGG